jgi:hypothetical protein
VDRRSTGNIRIGHGPIETKVFVTADGARFKPPVSPRELHAKAVGAFHEFGGKLDLSSLDMAASAYGTGGANAPAQLASSARPEKRAALAHQSRLGPPKR